MLSSKPGSFFLFFFLFFNGAIYDTLDIAVEWIFVFFKETLINHIKLPNIESVKLESKLELCHLYI